jgi:hypothetical protein
MQRDLSGNLVGYAGAGGRRGLKAKTLKRMLKKAGLKTSGKKSTLTKRAKSAHLIRGGYLAGMSHVQNSEVAGTVGGRRTRRRRRHH